MEDWKSLVAGTTVMRRKGGRSNPQRPLTSNDMTSSVVHGYQCLFTLRHFLPAKLLSKLKVVNDNLPLRLLQLGYS